MTMLLTILFMVISGLLVAVILIQRGQGGGLVGAFGGGGGQSAFGTKTGDLFTVMTCVLFVLFLLFAVGLNYSYRSDNEILRGTVAPAPQTTGLTGMGASTAPAAMGTPITGMPSNTPAPTTPPSHIPTH